MECSTASGTSCHTTTLSRDDTDRQFSWHEANANKVWPGSFSLADFISKNLDRYRGGRILELGSATGAWAIFLASPAQNLPVVTSDIDDGGDVENNIKYNFQLNGITTLACSSVHAYILRKSGFPLVPHVPHTWGTGWNNAGDFRASTFKYIIASDILLYVRYVHHLRTS
jgi:predicted nicotinamide N-methyase